MIIIETKLLQSRKLLIPALSIVVAMLFLALVNYWVGSGQKQLEGNQLAVFVSRMAFQSTIIALFYIIWVIQYSIHLQNSGFYKMLLIVGYRREQLFKYIFLQIGITIIILMSLNFLCYSILSFFYGINPYGLIVYSDFNALISQCLYLFIIAVFGLLIGFSYPSYVMIIPLFIYWLFESWLNSFIHRKFDLSFVEYFPMQSAKQLINENLLSSVQITVMSVYAFAGILLVHHIIRRKSFL